MVAIVGGLTANADAQPVDFSAEIQPLFARHCYKCHGPNKAEGGLRLSDREAALGPLESGEVAIVAGKPDAGQLLERVRSTDESNRMPPEGKGLSDEEIETLQNWIKQGAKWSDHWSFQPIKRPPLPQSFGNGQGDSPIDFFIGSRLKTARLKPSPQADRLTLMRRVNFGLIGLPPSADEIAAFLADDSPDALENLIDRLLASEQYGEKWARHWLDLVRYADTNGYERDGRKDLIWKYRDYVIRALNEDKPYDRFLLEQLAGDELPDLDAASITATGYYRLGIWDDEPADRELARYDYLDDILRTTSEGFLGITLGCARCHDHKIDPLLQSDYYSMLSFFSDISNHGGGNANHVPIATAVDQAAFDKQAAAKGLLEKRLTERIAELEAKLVSAARTKDPQLKLTTPKEKQPTNVLPDSIKEGQEWAYTFAAPADNWFQIAFDASRWSTGKGGFGTPGTPGATVRTRWTSSDIWIRKSFGITQIPKKLVLKIHHDEDAVVYLNGQQIAKLDGYVAAYKEIDVSAAAGAVVQTGRNVLAIHCHQTGGGQYIDAGLSVDAVDPIVELMRKQGESLLGKKLKNEWSEARRKLAASSAVELKFEPDFAMAISENGQRKTWILQRGLPALKGDEVGPRYPIVLNPPAAVVEPGNKTAGKRLALANWIVSADNPLTSRVIVNRVWQHHFGRGIVRSSSDFGYQGTPPTHPQLLDWLASEFIEQGWSLKKLHKQIMLSRTYQMSSRADPDALAQDPTNDLFWRFNMRRLNAEELRDSVLAVTGTLNPKMYGPPIFPPMSKEVLATSSQPGSAWGTSSADDSVRRSVYVYVKRSLRPPMLANFDAPDTDSSCAVRLVTTVPTQALGMLNSSFMNDQAEKFAARLKRDAGAQLAPQVALAIRLTSSRQAEDEEVNTDVRFIHELQAEEKLSADAALATYCLMILNTNEFVYLD